MQAAALKLNFLLFTLFPTSPFPPDVLVMALTTAEASSSSTTLTQESRPQAGPIPSKRGEIGFVEGVHEQGPQPSQVIDVPMPARHPADTPVPTPIANEAPLHSDTQTLSDDSSSMTDLGKPHFLGHKQLPKFKGVHFTTLVLLGAQILFFVGTVIGWVFAALALNSDSQNASSQGQNNNDPDSVPANNSGASHIFIHVAFAVVALSQLVLIERRIYRVRAERYAFKHPGEMLPTSRLRGHSANASMPVAPWHRPPLPTYAAALASSGVGTGDVEDAEIAPPPPPAYGKTRGSRLLLAGYLRDSLRVQAREYERDHRASGMSARTTDRPISFVSQDEEWEVRRDADRARRIEEALTALENTRPVMTSEVNSQAE